MSVNSVRAMLHEAAVGTGDWLTALKALALQTGCERGQLLSIGPDFVNFNWVSGATQSVLEEFDEIDGANPELSFRTAAAHDVRPLQICHEGHYADAMRRLSGDVYLDYSERHDIPYGNQTVLAASGSSLVGLATLRSTADGISTAVQRRTFARLIPHVRDAVELQNVLEDRGRQLLLGSFDAIGKVVLFLDPAGRCLTATASADSLLSSSGAIGLKQGKLICHDRRDQAALDRAIATVLKRQNSQGAALVRQAIGPPLSVKVHAFDPPESNIGFRPAAIVELRQARSTASDLNQWLASMGLTATEVEIAHALAAGTSRTVIADLRGSSIGTVRQQIKAIYSKLGVNREGELVALLGSVAGKGPPGV